MCTSHRALSCDRVSPAALNKLDQARSLDEFCASCLDPGLRLFLPSPSSPNHESNLRISSGFQFCPPINLFSNELRFLFNFSFLLIHSSLFSFFVSNCSVLDFFSDEVRKGNLGNFLNFSFLT